MLKGLRKVNVTDSALSRVQDAIQLNLQTIVTKEILDGVLGEEIELTTASKQVAHGLGRDPLGYIIVSKTAFADIIDLARDTRTITLQATAPVTLSMWFF